MLLSPGSRIWLAATPVDMRLGFDGLAAKVQGVLAADPFCGHAFVFRNRRGDRLKLLLWDGLGFWLLYRRLDHGQLHWPRTESGSVELSLAQWAMLVEGRHWSTLPLLREPLSISCRECQEDGKRGKLPSDSMQWAFRPGFRHPFRSSEASPCLQCQIFPHAGTPIPSIGILPIRISTSSRLRL